MSPATLTVFAFTLLASGVCVPFTLNPKLETDCSGPPAENQVAVIPDVSYPFRADYLTLHECKAYDNVPCSLYSSHWCEVDQHGKPHLALISPFYKTYYEFECAGWRSFLRLYANKFSIVSPRRALVMNIKERNDYKDPVHSDVFEPVRGQVIDLTVQAVAGTKVTSKIYQIGTLPSLVALYIEKGMNLSIKIHDFNRIPNVRVIVFHRSTIKDMAPYTFTDLPHLGSLSVDKGLWPTFYEMDQYRDWPDVGMYAGRWNYTDLDKIHRIHCDCSFAWYRNFLKARPELIEPKLQGTTAVIGNYVSKVFNAFEFDSYVASVDCLKNLTKDNYRAGDEFSFNTTCFGSC